MLHLVLSSSTISATALKHDDWKILRRRGTPLLLAAGVALAARTASECHTVLWFVGVHSTWPPTLWWGALVWLWWVSVVMGLWYLASRHVPVFCLSWLSPVAHALAAASLAYLHLSLLGTFVAELRPLASLESGASRPRLHHRRIVLAGSADRSRAPLGPGQPELRAGTLPRRRRRRHSPPKHRTAGKNQQGRPRSPGSQWRLLKTCGTTPKMPPSRPERDTFIVSSGGHPPLVVILSVANGSPRLCRCLFYPCRCSFFLVIP